VEVAGRQLLASAGGDATVRVWDPGSGEQRAVLKGHQGGVNGVCAVRVAGRQLLASAGDDATVRLWDPATEVCALTIPVHHPALAVCWADNRLAIGLSAGVLVIDLRLGA
jgi:WD40 repeat protein